MVFHDTNLRLCAFAETWRRLSVYFFLFLLFEVNVFHLRMNYHVSAINDMNVIVSVCVCVRMRVCAYTGACWINEINFISHYAHIKCACKHFLLIVNLHFISNDVVDDDNDAGNHDDDSNVSYWLCHGWQTKIHLIKILVNIYMCKVSDRMHTHTQNTTTAFFIQHATGKWNNLIYTFIGMEILWNEECKH